MRRRDLMLGAGAVGLASLLPRAASASAADRRFVFVLCNGGWDPTRVFLSGFDNPHVEMESDAEPWTVGDLDLVDHPDRPEVRAFFETWGDRAVVLNGMQLPAIDHFTCMKHLLTGDASGVNPDWSVRLAAAAPAMAMPSLVLSGPVFTGPHADTVVRAGLNGQLAGLVDPSDGALGEAWQPSEATAARLDAAMLGPARGGARGGAGRAGRLGVLQLSRPGADRQ
ncbi:MAG: hypothetical protein GY913_12325 [Proteobacteria bacterium]|nr:hypothetical protein [Pseudomonadota bacterium]